MAAETLAAIGSADGRVATLKMADRLHNMRTLEFLTPPKQLVKAREVLDIFASAAEQLSLPAIGSELQTLAFATLSGTSRPVTVAPDALALDIERSTSRPAPLKAELRTMLYELFDAALRSAGIYPEHRDPFEDRGDGLLALIHPVDQVPTALLLSRVVPLLARMVQCLQRGSTAGLPAGTPVADPCRRARGRGELRRSRLFRRSARHRFPAAGCPRGQGGAGGGSGAAAPGRVRGQLPCRGPARTWDEPGAAPTPDKRPGRLTRAVWAGRSCPR